MPLAIYLGFNKDLELYGFWLGFTIALVFLNTVVGIIVIRSDWSAKSLGEEKGESGILKSLKITRRNSNFAISPLSPTGKNDDAFPFKKSRLDRSETSSASSVRVRR